MQVQLMELKSDLPNRTEDPHHSSILSGMAGRNIPISVGLTTNLHCLCLQASASENSDSGARAIRQVLYHQEILRKKICWEIFAYSWNWLWRNSNICGQKRGERTGYRGWTLAWRLCYSIYFLCRFLFNMEWAPRWIPSWFIASSGDTHQRGCVTDNVLDEMAGRPQKECQTW